MHVQVSRVRSEIFEVALRGNSIEFNRNVSKLVSIRVAGGRWAIVSTNENDEKLIEKAKRLAKGGDGVNLAHANLAEGEFYLGSGEFDEDRAIEILKDIKDDFDFVEAVLIHERSTREIETSDGANAIEKRISTDLNVSVVKGTVRSIHVGSLGGLDEIEDKIEFILDELKSRIVKLINRSMRGKFDVILNKECACAFVHEIVHKLEADVLGNLYDGECLTVYDIPNGFGGYNFDDEGVLAEEKCIIDEGIVRSYLHTRETAFKFGTKPLGNGRGLFTIPKAFQTNLYVEKGDWKLDEMIEEVREGFIVEGLIKAEVHGEMLNIYPEIFWYIKGGKILFPLNLRFVSIPVKYALRAVKAVGREEFERISYEKGFAISETSPPIKVEAFVG